MPSKLQTYMQMADEAQRQITGSYRGWTGFLTTAARLYKYPYAEQVMIHAQRPDATACAEYDFWNEKMGRYVRRGSKGIALIDSSGERPRLRYVFDVSDTGGREFPKSRYLWEYRAEHADAVSAMLESRYGVDGKGGLIDQLERIASQLAEEYWRDYKRDILAIVDDSFLYGYDEFNVGAAFQSAAAVSIAYSLMSRCGLEADDRFEHEDFLSIFDFNTPEAAAELGTAVSRINGEVLRQIEVTVKNYEREKLAERSQIPREEIAFIHEANTETRKKELFAKVRSGQVRVLMGSTFKMGAGMNVQDRLVALHDLDCPWRPGDLEQRSGRIIRQGNRNKEVHIYRYVTESTFDAYLWQTVENKQKFISQIMTSKSPVRSCEDVDETALSYAEIKALCAGDERIKEKMDLDVDVARLKLMKASHRSQQFRLEDNLLRHFPEQIRQNESFVEGFTADMQTLSAHPHPVDGFAGMEVKGDLLTDKDNAGAAILEAFKDAKGMEPVPIGSYRGFAMSLTVEDFGRDFILTLKGKMNHRVTLGKDARGNLTRIDNILNAMPDRLQNVRNTLDALTAQMETAKAELGKPFPQEDELRTKSARLAELNAELNIDDRTPMEQMAEDAPAVQSAKAERPSVLAKLKAPLSQPCAEDKIRHRNKEER